MTTVKICGLQPGDDLTFTADKEISHAGFIFVKASRRYVNPEDVARMSDGIDPSCRKVGVYVNTPLDEILSSAQVATLDVVQLHGDESPALCHKVGEAGFDVWKSLGVGQGRSSVSELVQQLVAYADTVDAILLDAAPPKSAATSVTGGHGHTFDWSLLQDLADQLSKLDSPARHLPIWVAGGIQPENVYDLLDCFRPTGLDVSSGVEVDGRKSNQRIEALRKAVTRYADATTPR